jgi:hypothetical protein
MAKPKTPRKPRKGKGDTPKNAGDEPTTPARNTTSAESGSRFTPINPKHVTFTDPAEQADVYSGPVSEDEGDASGVAGNTTLGDSAPSGEDYQILADDAVGTVFTDDADVDTVLDDNLLEMIESAPGFSTPPSDSTRNDMATGTSTSGKTLFGTEGRWPYPQFRSSSFIDGFSRDTFGPLQGPLPAGAEVH